ncbi:MAG TPA: hypothetical protein VJU18_06875, partial [Vicinamibacteria bacterium]|nr:hypothetical protein [Vicinamibacteria bacterium]
MAISFGWLIGYRRLPGHHSPATARRLERNGNLPWHGRARELGRCVPDTALKGPGQMRLIGVSGFKDGVQDRGPLLKHLGRPPGAFELADLALGRPVARKKRCRIVRTD